MPFLKQLFIHRNHHHHQRNQKPKRTTTTKPPTQSESSKFKFLINRLAFLFDFICAAAFWIPFSIQFPYIRNFFERFFFLKTLLHLNSSSPLYWEFDKHAHYCYAYEHVHVRVVHDINWTTAKEFTRISLDSSEKVKVYSLLITYAVATLFNYVLYLPQFIWPHRIFVGWLCGSNEGGLIRANREETRVECDEQAESNVETHTHTQY